MSEEVRTWFGRWGPWVLLGVLASVAIVFAIVSSLSSGKSREAIAVARAELELTRESARLDVARSEEEAAAVRARIESKEAIRRDILSIEDDEARVRALVDFANGRI